MVKRVTITNINTGHKAVTVVATDTHEKALVGCGMSANETAVIEDVTGADEKLTLLTSSKPGTEDCGAFFSGLSRCLERNISMVKSLKLQVNRVRSPAYKGMIAEVSYAITQGEKFSDAMAKYPHLFSEDILSLLYAGEEAGQLARVCKRVGISKKKSNKTLKKLKGAMIYPGIVMVLGVAVVIVMSFTLVPALAKLFKSFGTELPFATKALIALSDLFLHRPYMVALPIVGFYMLFTNFGKIMAQKWMQDLVLKLPVIGELVRKAASTTSFRTLSMLTESNIRLTSALEITASATWHYHYKEFFTRLRDHITVGRNLHEGFLLESHWLGNDGRNLCGLIELASETGSGTEMLAEIADDYEEELDNMAASLDKLIEPLTMLFLGIIVGFLIYAIYGPMFSLGDVILKKKG
jgi:type IV pilus assembly protein PilC